MPHVELPQAEFKVVILGDTNTGKTSLVLRFAEGYYRNEARSATMGAFFYNKTNTNIKWYHLQSPNMGYCWTISI